MDCQSALDILEMHDPAASEGDGLDVAAAAAHVEACDDCFVALQSRRNLDRMITRAMLDVPVPDELSSRLLEVLEKQTSENEPLVTWPNRRLIEGEGEGNPGRVLPVEADESTAPLVRQATSLDLKPPSDERPLESSRRRVVQAFGTVAAALMLCTLGVWYFLFPASPQVGLNALRASLPEHFTGLPVFDGSFNPKLPGRSWQSDAVVVERPPRGVEWKPRNGQVAAAFRFQFRDNARRAVVGFLLICPKSRVTDPPQPSHFHSGNVVYTDEGSMASVAWTEGNFVYVCFVPNAGGAVESLERSLRGMAA